MKVSTHLINLNHVNGADLILFEHAHSLLDQFPHEHLFGCEMGIAYGGGVEGIGRIWGERGTVWGFDVFEDLHPKHLAEDPDHFEATCMDYWYGHDDYGTERLSISYQEEQLAACGITNVHLVKGEVHSQSAKDIPELHYAFLDMDIVASMSNGYEAVKNKIVPGAVLWLHDTQNIGTVTKWYEETVLGRDGDMWEEAIRHDGQLLVGLRRLSK